MAEKRRLLDIWIVESNTAYKAVPFETVANWLQQGRLLPEDRVRPAGTQDWYRIDSIRALAPYQPQPQPQRVEDQAEALEPVEAELSWRHPGVDEEDDPDMIPLIDVSLVLLIFFMMTAAVESGLFTPIDTPPAKNQLVAIKEGTFFVAIDRAEAGKTETEGEVRFGLGLDDKQLMEMNRDIAPVLARLQKELKEVRGEVRINLRADRKLPVEVIKETTLQLQGLENQINADRDREKLERLKFHISGEVRAPSGG
jgi:biopolymer transport protein ExbD